MPRADGDAPPLPASGRRTITPWLLLAIPPLCWAGNFVVGRAVSADIPPTALTFWRWVVAALVLAPFTVADAWALRGTLRGLLRRHATLLLLLAATGVVGFQFFVYQGLKTTTAINGVLIIATIPVAIPAVAFLLDGARIGLRQALGIAVSLAGVAIVVLRGDLRLTEGLHFAPGDFWVSLAVPAWAIYTVMLRRRPADLPPVLLLFASIVAGLLMLLPGYVMEYIHQGGFIPTPSALLAIGYVGVFASVIAFACWNAGVARVGAAKAGQFIHLMPVFATLLAIAFLGEQLHLYHLPGIATVALGIWLSTTARPPRS